MSEEKTYRVRLGIADPPDADVLAQIQARAFHDGVKTYGKGPPGFDSPQAQLRAMRMATYYKILVEDEIVGGIIVRVKDQSCGHYYLVRMFLDPIYHGKGIGTKAFKALEAKYQQASKWSLDTPYKDESNHRFYERLGFTKVGETEPSSHQGVPDKSFCLFLYEKKYEPTNLEI